MKKATPILLYPTQMRIIDSTARFRVVAAGRRFGKTTVGKADILIHAAKGKACWWLAPTYGMASQVWRDLKATASYMPRTRINESERRIDFRSGGWIAIHSTHYPDLLRGAGLDFAVLDEAAYMDSAVWPEVVRPMLLERQGRALFLSSPNGIHNWFYDIYRHGLKPASLHTPVEVRVTPHRMEKATSDSSERGGEVSTQPGAEVSDRRLWRSFHFPSAANPLIAPEELEAIRLGTPEYIWRTEYMAEFTADVGQVFRGIREAATAPFGAVPVSGVRYVFGLDWGRSNDATAIIVLDADNRQMVALDHFTGISWALQRGRLKTLYDQWLPVVIWAEANSIGSPNIEALQAEGLPVRPFTTTSASKPPLIESLALAIERRELALLPDENLLGELATYTLNPLPGGGFRYSAPSGQHDDLVIALALAWYAVTQPTILIDFV
jgi:hypothetical protein